jgi:uncharacterized protein involved in type VI secretion and phage assembly
MSSHSLGPLQELHLGVVTDSADPDTRGRIKVRLHSTGLELWAPVVTLGAGSGYGVSCLPRVGEQVVLAFLSPEQPLVLGAVWSGSSSAPEDASPVEERYVVRTPAGIQVMLDDASAGARVKIETPAGYHLTIDEGGGGKVTVEKGGEKIEMSTSGISITTSGQVKVEASQVSVSAGMVQVDAGMSKFSGVVQCDTLISNSVVSASYTPGAGNIW